MNYEIVTLEEKLIAGISARTSNHDPNMGAVIGQLWNRFFCEGIYASIPQKANEKALGLYTDYAKDETGEYTAVVACEVLSAADSDAFMTRKIPAGRYAKFVAKGDMRKAVADAWQEIWKLDLPRKFDCDFEEYQDDSMDNAEIHIYISLLDEN